MKQLSITILFLSFLSPIWSQQKADTTDVKVGLVLSGGGAKGLAHIGALKIIDSLGIRLDYIAGSSMGAIVGGLYASGYTAKQLDSLFHEVNFSDLIQDKIPRRSKTFYEKDYSEKYALTLPVVDGKVSLPKGISNGQNFYNFYSEVTAHVRHIRDFSKLPVAFFCTGTDIETGKGLVFDTGYLPDVIAASAALPTVYSPIKHNGKLVTDGGVTDNYPVEEIRRRGAEIVIGVDVQDTLLSRKQLNTVADIMLQISNFRTINDMKVKMPLTDIYIKPNIKRFSVVGFDDGLEIIKEGEISTLKEINKLQNIASLQKNKSFIRKPLIPTNKITINGISINNKVNYTRPYIKSKLRLDLPSTIQLNELTNGLNNLYSTGNFDRLRYKIINDFPDSNILKLDVEESTNKRFVRFSLHYDDLYKSAALLNYTHKNLLTKNDIFSFDLILGDQYRHNLEYYIDQGSYWSIGVNHLLHQYDRNIDFSFVRERRGLPDIPVNFIDIDYLDITSQFYLESVLKHLFAFRIGFEHKHLQIGTETLGEEVPGTVFDDINYYSIFSSLKFDSFNNKYFPTSGILFNAEFNGYPFSSESSDQFEEFALAKSKISYALPFSKRLSGILSAEAGVRLGKSTGINSLDFFLGGFGSTKINNQVSFLGYDFLQISGDSYIKSSLLLDYNLFKNHHINLTANYSNVGNRIFDFKQWVERVGFSGYGIGYGYDSIIGPIQVKYAFSPDKNTEDQLYISVGYWF